MKAGKSVIMILCLLSLLSCKPRKNENAGKVVVQDTGTEVSGSFKINGAYALYPVVSKWASGFMALHPGVKIEVVESGTGQGIADLIAGKAKLAMVSRPIKDEERQAGIWTVPVAKDGVAPIVNSNNPHLRNLLIHGLSLDKLQKVFTGEKDMKWGELLDSAGSEKVSVYSRADESGAADVFASFLFRKSSDLKGIKVTGDNEMIKNVQKDPLALGFCNVSYAFQLPSGEAMENIQVIPIDLDFDRQIDRKEIPFKNLNAAHRSIWLGIYPESLCRELSLASVGKPTDPAVKEFIRYVLGDGQKIVWTLGLCQLNNVYIRNSLDALNQ
jgi:phosphate transport system substrate-binding protein